MKRVTGCLLPLLISAGANAQETYTVCPKGCDYSDVQSAIDAIPLSGSGTCLLYTSDAADE